MRILVPASLTIALASVCVFGAQKQEGDGRSAFPATMPRRVRDQYPYAAW